MATRSFLDDVGSLSAPLPTGATTSAHTLHEVWVIFFWSGIGVAAIVYGLIAWCIVRYRRRPDDRAHPAQVRRNARWEIVFTSLPIVLAIGLFAVTYPAERHVEAVAAQENVSVDVTAFRWSWNFAYPGLGVSVVGTPQSPPVFELPLDETARFNVSSADVDHSFWIPAFLFKRDAIPGMQNVFDWTPTQLGTFRGECGEFCGLDHALMTFELRVVSKHDFDRWIAQERGSAG